MALIDVSIYGAVGDGCHDDTQAFQKAFDIAAGTAGSTVTVPIGNFAIFGSLEIPANVTLEGVFRAPTIRTQYKGSTLLAYGGRNDERGTPFISLNENSVLKGITVFYPEQNSVSPVAYPWCIRGSGDNCTILDTLLVNPWLGVDFATNPCGRHLIRGLYAQPLSKGLWIDQCYDVGRIENVHFWPFWDESLMQYHLENTIGFIFGKTDWQYVTGCFCIWCRTGFLFDDFGHGAGNVLLLNSGSDIGPCAVKVNKCMAHAGIAFTNCQFMAGIEIDPANQGPVKFANCGFWGVEDTRHHVVYQGSGAINFNQCHFTRWDRQNEGHYAIIADGSYLTMTGCDFMDAGKNHINIGSDAKSVILNANLFRGDMKIAGIRQDFQISGNA